jgi:hypothetical protein
MKKSWLEKRDLAKPYEIKTLAINISGMKAGQIILLPSPQIVDAAISAIPYGGSMDIPTLRKNLAAQFNAEVTCPVTMGFQLRIVAEAAFEAFNQGLEIVTPVWRVLDQHTPTFHKVSFDPTFLLQQRKNEGIECG